MTKSVCIVGAGPSGLVAAKTLLHDANPGTFKVTIFEAQPRIGGLWPSRKDDGEGLMHPLMIANQSRHTAQFSDLAWDESVPQMPRAWQVGSYLERYLERYVSDAADLRLSHRVLHAELQDGGLWRVQTQSDNGPEETAVFDYLLVSSGFFGKPMWPEQIPRDAEVPVVHSSKYRDLNTLLGDENNGRGGKILVVGGQMSGIEISGTIATHLSSALHSAGDKEIMEPDKYIVHHVAQRPAWVFPLFTTPKPDKVAAPFLPCDLPSYNLANRPSPLVNGQGHMTVDKARTFNSIYSSIVGTDQSEFSAATKIDGDLIDEPPMLAMSPFYMDFVRMGLITISKGSLASLLGRTATLADGSKITDIAAVVLATGFDPSPSISFLPKSVLDTLSHSASHPNLPLALGFHGTHHPSLPTLGFVGFYRSPYWGVMEMQARLIERIWSAASSSTALSPALQQAFETDGSLRGTLALREEPQRVSQFPMGDYPFLMQEFGRALDIPISPPLGPTPPLANGKSMDILTPARYSVAKEDSRAEEVAKNLASTHATAITGLRDARFVAGAVFRSLLGEWRLERDITSRLPSHPSGRFIGTARFLLREGTADGRPASTTNPTNTCPLTSATEQQPENGQNKEDGGKDQDLGLEYLYIEDGEFTAAGPGGMRFRATRRYVYRYDEGRDALSAWFVRVDDAARADYLFHELEFAVPSSEAVDPSAVASEAGRVPSGSGGGPPPSTERRGGGKGPQRGWRARASHLCVEDLYDVHYEFNFRAVNLRDWSLGYTVKGPKKDYSIQGVYTRP